MTSAQGADTREREPFDFGDYVLIEQKRYGVPNEMFMHKVIGRLESNAWIDVPAQTHIGAVQHDTFAPVLNVVCCGVSEDKVLRYRAADCKPARRASISAPAPDELEREAILSLSHRMDDAAQHITERQVYDFATELRVLLGLDGAEAKAAAIATHSAPAPVAAPRDAVSMPECWEVAVFSGGETLVSIGNDWLSGKTLEGNDEQVILGAANHLLSFIGYGLPASSFDPDEAAPVAAAPCVELQTRITELVGQHGSLRAAARALDCDPGYLSRLQAGEKSDPGEDLLYRMGLRRAVSYVPAAAPVVAEPSQTSGMNLGERIAHVGGRTNKAGYIEFGSVMAVGALINHVLRDLPNPPHAGDVRRLASALNAMLTQFGMDEDEWSKPTFDQARAALAAPVAAEGASLPAPPSTQGDGNG